MEINNIKVNVCGNEQCDVLVNCEGGGLNSQDVWVDVCDLVWVFVGINGYVSDCWYIVGGLLEVGGYLGIQGYLVGEWMVQGGIVSFIGNDVVIQVGLQINLFSGIFDVQGGYICQIWLKGLDGCFYEFGLVLGDLFYDGIYCGYEVYSECWDQICYFYNLLIVLIQCYENGYIVGCDVGSLVIGSVNVWFDGQVVGDIYCGEWQIEVLQVGLDGYNQLQNVVVCGVQLVVGCYIFYYVKSSGLLEYVFGVDVGSFKQVVIGVGEVVVEELILDVLVVVECQGCLSLDSELFNGFQLGGLKVVVGESI